ncbi:MAG TPA: Crp/Fnr family transcriptional regulator [Polyangiaceae bacterium]
MSSSVPALLRDVVAQTFLARLPSALVADVLSGGRRIDVRRGTELLANPKKPGVTIVVDGLVRVFLRSNEDRQVTVRYARPGETLGLVHFMRAKLVVHAQTVTDTTLWAISPRKLRTLAEASTPLTTAIAEDCAARVADALEELAFATFGTVRQRVARHLLDLAAADDDEDALVATVTPKSLAEATGSVREVIARVLKQLAAAGVIEKRGSEIVVLDASKLDAEARGTIHDPAEK